MQKLLITGGAGLLGLNWALQARSQYEVHTLLHKRQIFIDGVISHKVDWNDEQSLTQNLKVISPEIVINTVGCTDLDLCETNPTISFLSNVKVAEICARLAEGTNARYVHISTDHLFDGLSAYAPESKKPKPLNTYARHKAQAEIAVHKACHSALICRTNFIGWGPTYRRSFR